jgi:excinuclease ABC subunit B
MSEDLTEYLESLDFKVRYLHSDIDTMERTEILRDLRKGDFDILVGINLLREGLDLPEVALVAILDADKEGFLRSTRSLVQISGRAARNINGRIILYADTETDSIRRALEESARRRKKQIAYNIRFGTTPRSIERKINDSMTLYNDDAETSQLVTVAETKQPYGLPKKRESKKERVRRSHTIREREKEMMEAAKNLEFEKAAKLRDMIERLRREQP